MSVPVPSVRIVVPVHGRLELTRQCLEHLEHATPRELYELVVVDNGSTDGTAEFLAAAGARGRLEIVTNAQNEGFAAACNRGAAGARTPFLLFLNNDTAPTDGWLEALLDAAADETVGIAGARLLYPDGLVQHAGLELVDGVPDHVHRREAADAPEVTRPRDLDMVTGACLLVRRDLFERVRGFDLAYRNGVEDVELCLRVRREGYRIRYEPRALVYHYEGQTPGRFDHVAPNVALFRSRWGRSFDADGRLAAPPPLVTIVIPVLNRRDLTEQCLDAIERTVPWGHAEVVVVDNGSTDGTRDLLRTWESEGRLRAVCNNGNAGFGAACNQAAALARGEHLLLLNNDTIPEPGWLETLVTALDDPGVGIVGSRLLYPDRTIQHAGIAFAPNGLPFHAHRGVGEHDPAVLEDADVAAVTGACLLIRGETWRDLGGFDDLFFFYVEDVDLCIRAWDAGYRVVYRAGSVVVHLENASVTDAAWRDERVLDGSRKLHERWAGRWPAAVRRLAWPVELPGGPRHFVCLAYADELAADPDLLAAYGRAFGTRADATLLIALRADGGDWPALSAAVETAGLAESGPDLLAVPLAPHELPPVSAVYSRRPADGPLAALPRFDPHSAEALAALAAAAPSSVAA